MKEVKEAGIRTKNSDSKREVLGFLGSGTS